MPPILQLSERQLWVDSGLRKLSNTNDYFEARSSRKNAVVFNTTLQTPQKPSTHKAFGAPNSCASRNPWFKRVAQI
jgi:hypothetical protein